MRANDAPGSEGSSGASPYQAAKAPRAARGASNPAIIKGAFTIQSAPTSGVMREDSFVAEETAANAIVVVTGVFDLLHIGHLRFLEAARRLGDQLIVGVESDERVRRWKGPNRPIQTEDDRLALLRALRVVDDVFLITGERVDPAYYADLLRPFAARYIAVTADDPFLEQKRDAMRAIGVELRVVTPRIENYSTSHLVQLLGLP